MRIGIVGAGYAGLVTGTCLAEMGNYVTVVDRDPGKIATLRSGRATYYEPGLEELLARNLKNTRLDFSGDTADAVRGKEAVFLCVDTPSGENGAADLSNLDAALLDVVAAMDGYLLIVVKSTVPPGTNRRLEAVVRERAAHEFDLASNPEFLKEGAAIKDFMTPDRVVVGVKSERARNIMRQIYGSFFRTGYRLMETDPESAEMIKYAANVFLAARVSLINEIAGMCQAFGANAEEVRVGIGLDKRIGSSFLFPGLGYGGSCFPKDVRAVIHFAEESGLRADICRAVAAVNARQGDFFLPFVEREFGADLSGRRFAVWGLSYKPRTDDVRESPGLRLARILMERGARVAGFDPEANANASRALPSLEIAADGYEALDAADALFLCTEWNQFRNPDWEAMERRMKRPLVFDGRNIFSPEFMAERGFHYYSVGRPPVTA